MSFTIIALLCAGLIQEPELLTGAPQPDWFVEHVEWLTQGSGKWVADNSHHQTENEQFDYYVIEWIETRVGTGATGRLYGITDGEPSGSFWEYRTYWDALEGRAVAAQWGTNGSYGFGVIEPFGEDGMQLVQQFAFPNAPVFRQRHEHVELEPGVQITRSMLPDEEGGWRLNREYRFELAPEDE